MRDAQKRFTLSATTMSVYHEGEVEAQARCGVRGLADQVGRIVGSTIPAQAAAFLTRRSFVIASTMNGDGDVHASLLYGDAGFAEALDPSTLSLRATGGDLTTVRDDLLSGDGSIGLVAIDFATRRRIRVNGRGRADDASLTVSTREVYSNCPQYIHPRRDPQWKEGPAEIVKELTGRHITWIESADTFFIASAHPSRGADASHRGGEPGFVTATPSSISWFDFPGNNMFNTVGNLLVHDRCSLLFLDFSTGTHLRVDGRAHVDFNEPREIEMTLSR